MKEVDSKGNETSFFFDNIHKYKDAILFRVKHAKLKRSDQFQVDMNSFIDSWKKENQTPKKRWESDRVRGRFNHFPIIPKQLL